ncbi:hypothetical protein GGR58DRAFT_453900 [Xylaria digitata]|nr:hypothetical protein GGR58DRAFT_453900 [Xylaria digitata]
MERVTTRDDAPAPSAVTTSLIIVSAIFPFISGVALILRSYALRKGTRSVSAEDIWFWVAWISSLLLSIIIWVFSRSGINYYSVDLIEGTQDSLRLIFLSSVLIQLPLAAVKIAILLFYKRIFATRAFAIGVWVSITIVCLWGVLFFFLTLFLIRPLEYAPIDKVQFRYDLIAVGLAQVATSIALDVLVLCLPLPVLFRLHMDLKRKWAIVLVFCLGIFCVAATIVRLVLLSRSTDFFILFTDLRDTIYIFAIIEPNVSILAACFLTYRSLIKSWRVPEFIIRRARFLSRINNNNTPAQPVKPTLYASSERGAQHRSPT